ncbi:MAG: serine/threonine protein kinase, partial [candidate division NC10 bacterium]|nr:serine/threonine protein kinase [candidate division NC10 bacterium]
MEVPPSAGSWRLERAPRGAGPGRPEPTPILPGAGVLPMPLFLTEDDVARLLTMADALEAVEEAFRQ